jgi:hypothetical protein
MRTIKLGAIVAAVTLGLAVNASLDTQPAAAAQNARPYCESYAREAVSQYRAYTAKQCGGGGSSTMWSPSYATHLYYCLRAPQAMIQRLRGQRQHYLAQRCNSGLPRNPRYGRRG